MTLFRYTWRSFSRELTLLLGGLLFALPLYLLVVLSLQTTAGSYANDVGVPSDPRLSNFSDVWSGQGASVGMGQALLNSTIITVGSVACLVVFGSLAAYAIARRPSKLSDGLYLVFVLGIIVPYQLAIVPLYVVMQDLGLTGTYLGMVLLYTGLFMPLAVFLFTGFIRALPKDYEEAAQVDGANMMRTLLRVVLPLIRPITGTVAILTGLTVWNDFYVSLVFLNGTDHVTLPVAINSLASQNVAMWNIIFAGVVIAIAPMLCFFAVAQRQLIRGFTSGVRG